MTINVAERRRSLPRKQSAEIAGHVHEYVTSGVGQPVITLLNGSGGPLESWSKIYPELERLGTVFAYNRLGIGGSAQPTTPQSGEAIVSTLRALLDAAGLQAPFLLVGHSLGGLYANLFARRFPDEIAGVVLLDATDPRDVDLMERYRSGVPRVVRAVVALLEMIAKRNANHEAAVIAETVRQVGAAGPFPDVPMVVVTGGKSPPSWLMPRAAAEARKENQKSLCALSRRGRQIVAARSGHFPQFTEPDLVVQAVREVVAEFYTDALLSKGSNSRSWPCAEG